MQKIRYRFKKNVGPHYREGKQYGPGDIIELYEHEAKNLAYKVDQLDPSPPEPEPEVSMVIVETENDMFDAINEITGDTINSQPLTLSQAQDLVGADVPVRRIEVDPGKIKAIHRGGGRYKLVWDSTEQPIVERYFTRGEASNVIKAIAAGEMTADEIVESSDE